MTAPVVDAHQHFWRIARGDYEWLTPALGPIHRDFGPDDLAPILARCGVDRTVLVQAAATTAETRFLLELAERTPFVAGVVGWIDFESDDVERDLDALAASPRLLGVRPMIQDVADVDWMLGAAPGPAFQALVDRDLTFDALVKPPHLPNLLRLIDRHPGLRVVVDHAAKPAIRDGAFDEWARDLARIACETEARCKLSGLVTEAGDDRSLGALEPYLDHVVQSFGPDRVMWGSDWPVCILGGGYEAWHDTTFAYLARLDATARARILGGTASEFYRLDARGGA